MNRLYAETRMLAIFFFLNIKDVFSLCDCSSKALTAPRTDAHTQLRRIDEPKVIKLQCQKRNEKKEPSTRKIYVEQPPNGE